MSGPRLGAHTSIAGGLHRSIARGERIGCQTIQIFTGSSHQWHPRQLTDDEINTFREASAASEISPIIAHDSYLINLASPEPELLARSRRAFLAEMLRTEALGIPFLVMHPGAHKGSGEEAGLATIAESLDLLHRETPGLRLKVLLETTAGQGTCLGYSFDHLQRVIDTVEEPERLGVCLDTCHVHAAGYDIGTPQGYEAMLQQLDNAVGLERLAAIHLNDSKTGLGSRVDRHEHIGRGSLGLEPFRMLVNDPRLLQVPMILETPKGRARASDADADDIENLVVLRQLLAQ